MNTEIIKAMQTISEAKKKGLKGFKIVGCENGCIFESFAYFPYKLKYEANDYEYIYALIEREKEVLTLNIGESMYFQPNRDDETSKAIIIRLF